MEFDAWTVAGVAGGSAALSYLAAGWRKVEAEGENKGALTLRLSIDKSGSLLGDVRVLGGALTAVSSYWTKGKTKDTLQAVAAASFLSVLQTEIIRYRLAKQNVGGIAKNLPVFPESLFPKGTYLGDHAVFGAEPVRARAPARAWAAR